MPAYMDPETIHVDELPAIWSPVQWEIDESERIQELHLQATASLLWVADSPEAMLRVMLSETDIERTLKPPDGYDPELQGEWDDDLVTFVFKRPFKLVKVERENDFFYAEYKVSDLGFYAIEIESDKVSIYRI